MIQTKDINLQECLAVMHNWKNKMEKAAFDPEYQAELAEIFFGEEHLRKEYIDQMLAGTADFMCCRLRSCRAIVPQSRWLHNKFDYYCSLCATKFQPWHEQKCDRWAEKLVRANRICMLSMDDQSSQKSSESSAALELGRCKFYLMWMSDTDIWNFRQFAANLTRTCGNMQKFLL